MHFKIERLVFFRMEWYHSHITLAADVLTKGAGRIRGWGNGGLGEWEAGGGSGIDAKLC